MVREGRPERTVITDEGNEFSNHIIDLYSCRRPRE
jgi:hypothetical protein